MIEKYTNGTWEELEGYKKYGETTFDLSSFPASFQSGGLNMSNYRIYGANGGVGEQTENLFDVKDDMLEASSWEINPTQFTKYFMNYKLSELQVQILKQRPCTCSVFENFSEGYIPGMLVFAICPAPVQSVQDQYRILTNNGVNYTRTFDFSSWDDIYLVIGYGAGFPDTATKQLKIDELFTNWLISIVLGSTAPAQYIPYGYQINAVVRSINLANNSLTKGYQIDSQTGNIVPQTSTTLTHWTYTVPIGTITRGDYYKLSIDKPDSVALYMAYAIMDNGVMRTYASGVGTTTRVPVNVTGTLYIDIYTYNRYANTIEDCTDTIMITINSEPEQFIPYSRTDTPIYIGDTPLAQGEYVDYGEQKVYKYVGGELTPTDPPVVLPALPTIDGVTMVDFDNTPKPSRMTGEAIRWTTMTPKIYENGAWT